MEKHFYSKLILMCLFSVISFGVLADTLYRCPKINEFSYDQDGSPTAITNVNGVVVNWYGYQYGGSPYAKATSLKIVVLNNGGYGHPYQIRCTYNDESGAVIDMYVLYGAYEATKTSGPNWTGDDGLWMCSDAHTNSCQFFISQA